MKTWRPCLLLLACLGMLHLGPAWASLAAPDPNPAQATTAVASAPISAQAAPIPVPGFPEPLIATGPVSAEDERALKDFLARQPSRTTPDLAAFQAFLDDHPHSPYRLAMLTDLGLAAYREGAFSQAIALLEAAFQAGRTSQPQTFTQQLLADRATGELLRMHARLGHMARLETLLGQLGSAPLAGIGAEYAQGAREGLWHMRHDPGVAFLCGPMALLNLVRWQQSHPHSQVLPQQTPKAIAQATSRLLAYRSPPDGVHLDALAALADQVGLALRAVHREPGAPIPVGAVVHWKVHHYAAIVEERAGRFHLIDPTFDSAELWVSKETLEQEASGYFLVPQAMATQQGFAPVSMAEARGVYGMGWTQADKPHSCGCESETGGNAGSSGSEPSPGMTLYTATEYDVSLTLHDTPLSHQAILGPPSQVTLTYDQRATAQPTIPTFGNLGPNWSTNWQAYVEDDPATPGARVRRVQGGGQVDETDYDTQAKTFAPELADRSVLVRTAGGYQRLLADGSQEVYAASDGAAVYPRRLFLSALSDAAGNTLTLDYDQSMRLVTIRDAAGEVTRFHYDDRNQPLLLSTIEDPFGRQAKLDYDTDGRLVAITDAIGITSRFTYQEQTTFIQALTTPYGTTHFSYQQLQPGPNPPADIKNPLVWPWRFLEMTDPLGFTERLEERSAAPGIASSDPLGPPAGMAVDTVSLQMRNTYYWDKSVYPRAQGKDGTMDYTQARIRHWYHWGPNGNLKSDVPEGEQYPLEGRIWYETQGHHGNTSGVGPGAYNKPIAIGRLLPDGTSQVTRMRYNAKGNITQRTDPAGRTTSYSYAPNGLDVTSIAQNFQTIARLTYNAQHRPITISNAAGGTTSLSYNPNGQLTAATDPLGRTTRYHYDLKHRLVRITDANGKLTARLDYDRLDRIQTLTDSEGKTTRYDYDAADRLTAIHYEDGTDERFHYKNLDLVAATDRERRTATYDYDNNRNLTAIHAPEQRTIRYDYEPNGTLQALSDGLGHTTTFRRDIQGRLTQRILADGTKINYSYDSAGRLITITDAAGRPQQLSYTIDDRISGISHPDAQPITYSYDQDFPRLAQMHDGSGTTSYRYGPLGAPGALQLAAITTPFATIGYTHDKAGQTTSTTVAGSTETYRYDALGRLATTSNDLGTFGYAYLGETSAPTAEHLEGLLRPLTAYHYENNRQDRRLAAIDHPHKARSYAYQSSPYTIDAIDEQGRNRDTTDWRYFYDNADRLVEAHGGFLQDFTFDYDRSDNLTRMATPDGTTIMHPDQTNAIRTLIQRRSGLPGPQRIRPDYDKNGNLTDDGVHHYTWDGYNHLTGITYHGHPRWHTTLAYDGLDHLVTITERDGRDIETQHLLWCGEAICAITDDKGQLITRLFQQGEWHQGQVLYYAKDHLGSIRDVLGTLPPAGELINLASTDYGPYGERLDQGRGRRSGGGLGMGDGAGLGASSLSEGQGMGDGADPDGRASAEPQAKHHGTIQSTLGYAGMFYHARSGLYLTHYRAYDPRLGRWLSRDPIWEAGGINLYGYVGGDPVGWVDPWGLAPGDPYPTPDAAGEAAIRDINPTSIRENREYGGMICRYATGKCFYTPPNKGTKDSSHSGFCPAKSESEGNYHTHGAYDPHYDNENFSDRDKSNNDRNNRPGYLGTPSGDIKRYSPIPGKPHGGSVTTIGCCAK